MRLGDQIEGDFHAALAALAWQLDCGIDEAIGDESLNRYDLPESLRPAPQSLAQAPALSAQHPQQRPAREARASTGPADALPAGPDPVAVARAAAERAETLEDLARQIAAFDLCDLKKGARNTVFADGDPRARVLVLGEAPGRDEDIEGRPFVGRAGQLLDQMFAAIGLSRHSPDAETALYITNVMPWRPPQNRDPEPAEIAMMLPFVERHIRLADPDIIVVMGNTPLVALTGSKGILRARGVWGQALGKPLLPMTHPAYLLRNPLAKREAWADLLSLRARLMQGE